MAKVDDKNPKDNNGETPLHYAAENGHLAVCQYIMEEVDDKNPKNNSGHTAFQLAAQNGHWLVCQGLTEKNPQNDNLHLALDHILKQEETQTCKICMIEKISRVFIPCGHATSCEKCTNEINICPICRANIERSVEIFSS